MESVLKFAGSIWNWNWRFRQLTYLASVSSRLTLTSICGLRLCLEFILGSLSRHVHSSFTLLHFFGCFVSRLFLHDPRAFSFMTLTLPLFLSSLSLPLYRSASLMSFTFPLLCCRFNFKKFPLSTHTWYLPHFFSFHTDFVLIYGNNCAINAAVYSKLYSFALNSL